PAAASPAPSLTVSGKRSKPPSPSPSPSTEAATVARRVPAERIAADEARFVELDVTETDEAGEERTNVLRRMTLQARSDVRYARALRDRMHAVEDEKMASRFARMLRWNEDADFVAEMRDLALEGESARERRTALLALESKSVDVWWEPAVKAYRVDASPAVRDEAAGVLGRHLSDRRYVRTHAGIRSVLKEGTESDEATDRARALRSMLADRTATEAELDWARALRHDPDETVRREVDRFLRVQTARVQR
ncbi:MAG: hypothetical protein AAGD14_18335, partial [Planctomycetota bacterium]